ncbi:MAG: hypothetical protein ACRD9R_20425 [Pyrinomonadaceae bacterium]
MSVKERIVEDLKTLSETELEQVERYLASLKCRTDRSRALDEDHLASLYAEFAEEDRELAEQGIEDYVIKLADEDAR